MKDGGRVHTQWIGITSPQLFVIFPTQKGVRTADLSFRGNDLVDYINLYWRASPYQKDNAGTGRPVGQPEFYSLRERIFSRRARVNRGLIRNGEALTFLQELVQIRAGICSDLRTVKRAGLILLFNTIWEYLILYGIRFIRLNLI